MKRYLAEGILWAIAAITMILCVILDIKTEQYFAAAWCAIMSIVDSANSYFGFKRYFRTRKK